MNKHAAWRYVIRLPTECSRTDFRKALIRKSEKIDLFLPSVIRKDFKFMVKVS